jgi:threonine dehydrogenase-like Zn-dependent dehydrogenase
VDQVPSRLDMAREQGAEVIDFNSEDPVEAIQQLTGGAGVDRVIDCVGIDAEGPHGGPASKQAAKKDKEYRRQLEKLGAPGGNEEWHPGGAPSQAFDWAVDCMAKAGTLAIIGVYPEKLEAFPIGKAMMKDLTIQMGNCNHRK